MGRGKPRWSVGGQFSAGIWSKAGLFVPMAMVWVGLPLLARAPSFGSLFVMLPLPGTKSLVLSELRLYPPSVKADALARLVMLPPDALVDKMEFINVKKPAALATPPPRLAPFLPF